MDKKDLSILAAELHKFYDVYKDKLSISERHSLVKSYLTVEFFDRYISEVTDFEIPIVVEEP